MAKAAKTIELQGEQVQYEVIRSADASQVRIDVGLGGVEVVLPQSEQVEPSDLLQQNDDWVLEQTARYQSYRDRIPDRTFEEGEEFPLFGIDREIEVVNVLWHHETDESIRLAERLVKRTSIQNELERFYRSRAEEHFTKRADHFAKQMRVVYSRLQIRNQKTRWGSFSPRTKTLSLNWRLVMAPPEVIDYVIVHELAHDEAPHHGQRFWRIVAQHVPEYEEHAQWLEENGVELVFEASDL